MPLNYRQNCKEDTMRPEAYELEIKNFPFTVELSTRFGDTDVLGHINNVAIAGLFEESRVKFGMFSRNSAFEEMSSFGAVVTASVIINYLGEVFYPDPVTIAVGVDKIGKSSHTLSCLMIQNSKPVAHNRTVLVQFSDNGSTVLPQELVDMLEKFSVKKEGLN